MSVIGGRCKRRMAVPAVLLAAVFGGTAAVPAPALDVQAPEAGITDPIASMPALDRNCRPGQVDVNTATTSAISSALQINSRPTLERIVAGRPWLKTADLISVPGVPPSAAARLQSHGCATPTQLPMPTPLACTTATSAVDVQAASSRTIADRLKLPRSVADSLVAARPLPQDLRQVATPEVPGFPDPKLNSLVAEKRLCVTPAPFTLKGTTWRWASEQHGVVAAAAGKPQYALIVPARAVAGPTGAWARITPRSETPLARSTMHIHGAWGGEVASRLPDLAEPVTGKPAIVHDTATGVPALSWGNSVAREMRGSVVAPLRSLSDATAIDLSDLCATSPVVDLYGRDDGSLFCSGDSPRDTSLHPLLRQRADYAGRYVARSPVSGPCGTVGTAVSYGGLPVSLSCSTSVLGSTATWTLNNNSGVQLAGGLVTAFGTVARRVPLGNFAFTRGAVTVDSSLYGLVGNEVAKRLVANASMMLPGTSVDITKTRGSGPSTFKHDLALSEWADYWSLFNALQIVDAGLDIAGVDDVRAVGLTECLEEIGGHFDLGSVQTCVSALADAELSDQEAAATARGDSGKARKLAGIRSMLKVAGRALSLTDLGASFIVQASAASKGSDNLTLDFLPPPRPVGGGLGGLSGDGTFIARTAGGEGFLVDPSAGTAKPITNGGDFFCYARTRFVIDQRAKYTDGSGTTFLHLDPPIAISSATAPPCTGGAAGWTYTAPPQGNTPFNVILRGADDGGVTSSWLINSSGQIQTIPDGGTYECLTYANPVIWNVPFDKIQAWANVGTEPASCG